MNNQNTLTSFSEIHFKHMLSYINPMNFLYVAILIILFVFSSSIANAGAPLGDIGTFAKWTKIELILNGPNSSSSGSPNPFDTVVDVTFTAPSGNKYVVPGFYDGNGSGNPDGNIWKVRFSSDETGVWSFSSTSTNSQLAGYSGSFNVTAPANTATNFYKWGRLEYTGTSANKIRYMKFRDGGYWLKAGADDPENFLGNFSNYNTLTKRKAAIDYLSSKGINSLYIMTHNINGDGNDVWPWLGSSVTAAKSNGGTSSRFDVIKLDEWNQLFEYMQMKGMVVYMILEDDSAWTAYDHDRYYREMVARFAYLPALLFNIAEEANENYSLTQALNFAQTLKKIDPYNHPVAIHNVPLWPATAPNDQYLNSSAIDFTSLQTKGLDPLEHNQFTLGWINRAKSLGTRVPVINYDEARPILDRKSWWSAYIGGGVWEAHIDEPYDRPMSAWESIWNQLSGTKFFMESLPFWEMEPNNALVTNGTAFALAKAGEAYAFYLPGGGTISVNLTSGTTYDYAWWNPSNSQLGSFQNSGTISGGIQQFTPPAAGDWALRIIKSTGQSSVPNGSITGNVATGTYPAIKVDSVGNIHLVYSRAGKLQYKKYDVSNSSWSGEQDTGITQFSSYRNDPDIAVDSSNKPHVVGGQGDGTGQYAYWDGTSWQKIAVGLNRDTAITIDNSDNVYISDRGGNNGGYIGVFRRSAGGANFDVLQDPDTYGGLSAGINDHVYGHIFANHSDNSVSIVYRHGAPQNTSCRTSADGGLTWTGAGISSDNFEAPHGTADASGNQYVITGNGKVFKLVSGATSWTSLGNAFSSLSRELPNLAVDAGGNIYAVNFGGKYNIYASGSWSGEKQLSSISGQTIGFTRVACRNNDCYVAWEESNNVSAENDNFQQNFSLNITAISNNTSGTPTDTVAPSAPTNVLVE